MTRYYLTLLQLFLVCLLFSSATAQTNADENKQQMRQNRRLQAVLLIKQTVAEGAGWENKDLSVHVISEAADLLWDETPGQGRQWLTRAWKMIDDLSESPVDENLKDFSTRSNQSKLRTAVLTVARKHDVELANKLIKELSEKPPSEKRAHGAFDDRTERSQQLLELAQQAVETNPEMAFNLAEESLADGVSYNLQNLLTSLRRKSIDLANRLYDLALARFAARPADPSEGEVLAGYLFKPGFSFSTNSNGRTILAVNPAQQNLPAVAITEPQRAKNFLIAVYQMLLSQPVVGDSADDQQRIQRTLVLGNRIIGLYHTYAPELEPSARGFLAQLQGQAISDGDGGPFSGRGASRPSSDNEPKKLTKEELYEANLKEMEDRAENKKDPIARKLTYVQAALAVHTDDCQRAIHIAEKIDDSELRSDATSFLLYRAALFFIEKGDLERAREIVPTITDKSRQSVAKIALAQRLLSSKSVKGAAGEAILRNQRVLDLLSDLDRDLLKGDASANTAKILLSLTATFASIDKGQALVSLGQAVQTINKLSHFDLRDTTAPGLGLSASSSSGLTVAVPRMGFDFRSAIDPLIEDNFEQVSTIADRLATKELSGVAHFEIASAYLKKFGPVAFKQTVVGSR